MKFWRAKNNQIVVKNNEALMVSPWTPALTDTVAWYDAADISTVGLTISNTVSSWDDKSGNTKNLTQTTVASQPLYNTRTIGSLNGVEWNGADRYLNFSSLDLIGKEVYCTLHIDSLTAADVMVIGDTGNAQVAILKDAVSGARKQRLWRGTAYPSDTRGTYTFSDGEEAIVGWLASGISTKKFTVNGTLQNTADVWGGVAPFTVSKVGRSQFSTNCDFVLGELIIIDETVSSTEIRQKIEGYLAWKWGLEGNLPSDHPYKNRQPIR